MRHVTRTFTFALLTLALIVAMSALKSKEMRAQQGGAGARKKVLFLTYPGVGAAGSHGHASLPPAEEQAVAWGKVGGFDVTTLKGYQPGVGKQDLSFFTTAYLNQFDGLMMMANGDIGMTPVQKKAIVDFVRSGKAFIGVHCATVMMYDFPEYGEMLGAYYFNSIFTPLLGNDVPVTPGEFDILKIFAENPNRPLSRDWLLETTSHRTRDPFDRAIDLRITRIRRKIEPAPDKPTVIRTVRGVGYMFVPPAE